VFVSSFEILFPKFLYFHKRYLHMISSIVVLMLKGREFNISHWNRTQLVITSHCHAHLFASVFV